MHNLILFICLSPNILFPVSDACPIKDEGMGSTQEYLADAVKSTVTECYDYCIADVGCKFWTWQKTTNKQCFLYSGDKERSAQTGFISGARECNGEYLCAPYHITLHTSALPPCHNGSSYFHFEERIRNSSRGSVEFALSSIIPLSEERGRCRNS